LKGSYHSRGVLLMLLSSFFFSLMAIALRFASDVPFFKSSFIRFLVGVLIVMGLAFFSGRKLRFVNRKLLFVRGIVGSLGAIVYFFAVTHLGLARGTIYFFTFPIFAAILSPFLIKEKVRAIAWVAVGIALAGVFLISRPASSTPLLYNLIALMSGFTGGLVAVLIRQLRKTDSAGAIYFSQAAFGLLFTVVPANINPEPLTPGLLGLLLAVGIFASVGQLLMNLGYTHLPAAEGSLIGLLTPVFNIAAGVILFRETLSALGWVGCAMVLLGCLVLVRREPRMPLP